MRAQEKAKLDNAARAATSVASQPAGILVVENDPDLQWRLARTLTVNGNRVVGTSSGDGAMALLGQWPVDLVLVAEDLPGVDGFGVAKAIRDCYPGVPVVLMAEQAPNVQMAARLAGAVACLVKPFRLDAVRELIDSLELSPVPAE